MKKKEPFIVTATYYDSRTNEEITEKEFIKRAIEKQLGNKQPKKKQ